MVFKKTIIILALSTVVFAEDTETLFDRGVEHYNRGDYEQAIEDFVAVLRLEPRNSDAKWHLEMIRREGGFETIDREGGIEVHIAKKACKSEGNIWIGGACKSQEQVSCESKGNIWQGGVCKSLEQICESEGNIWIEGVCKSQAQITCEKEYNVWRSGTCKTKTQIEQEDCKAAGKTWQDGACKGTKFGVRGGYIRNSISIDNAKAVEVLEISDGSYTSSGPMIGFTTNVPIGGTLSLNLELNLFLVIASDRYSVLGYWSHDGTDFIGEEGPILNASILVQFMPLKSLPFFLIAGPRFDFNALLDNNETYVQWDGVIYGQQYVPETYSYATGGFSFGLTVGAGYYITQDLTADFRYALINIEPGRTGSSSSQWGLGLTYYFGE